MAALPICDELRRSVGKSDWEPQFILRCRREISEDLRLARKINALCMRLTAIVDKREVFADELDMLAGKYVPDKIAQFTKQSAFGFFWVVGGWSKRDLFADFSRLMLASLWSFACSEIVAWVDGGVPDVDIYMLAKVALVLLLLQRLNHPFLLAAVQRDGEEGRVYWELKALGDCEGVIETVRFMEGLQQDDMEKRDRSLLLMREMEVKAREKSRFILKLSDKDKNITTKLNRLREEMLIICEKRRNLADELRSIRGIVVVGKAAEFVADTVRKDNAQVAQLREVESQMEFRALEKELHVQKITGNIPY
ncbi:hypothetical protein Tco_0588483 [Tanacetum coccineum]